MPFERVNGLGIAYEIIGVGDPWVITPGGRFSKDAPGVRELAEALASTGKAVVIWDRPNTGASEISFDGESESALQADVLAALLGQLDVGPAVIAGGSGGSRVSLLAAARHPEVARALAIWWISGGPYGLLTLGTHYCGDSIAAAWRYGMEAVAALPEWAEVLERNPANLPKLLAQEPRQFIARLEEWMLVYCPRPDELVPGLPDAQARAMDIPALVFRSGASDPHHTRATSETLAALLPGSELVEPPWGDREWTERTEETAAGVGIFSRWPLLAPQLIEWAETL
ncbi:MAG TPA: alpha/beta hydrolase [Acidimicrobiales bacterium]|jgi:pimeloyl-ACP methyl ester carboxylesterase|nr:alpha/beta hydrolase [Acidimicrobiales bacterium]